MTRKLTINRLNGLSFFKLCFIGNTVSFVLVWIGVSIPALFGSPLVKWEDEYISGTMSMFAGPLAVAALGLLFSMAQFMFAYLGLMLFSSFANITIGYRPEN